MRARAQLEILRAQEPDLADELERLLALEDDSDDFMAQPLLDKPGQPQAGTLVGPYRLESVLGEGGMGMVWLASRADGLYQRQVALKLLRPAWPTPTCACASAANARSWRGWRIRTSRACWMPASAAKASPTWRWNTSKACRSPTTARRTAWRWTRG